ncbi:MAG: 4Fe-4S binding protein [Methanobrevibacter sp.]|jgi:ferredoxin|nr:4Fe-4S binding protein [Methanobrevibacter sp.]
MIVVNQEDCIKCGACEGTCPSTAIVLEGQKVVNCDICGGAPKCVEICPNGALDMDEVILEDGKPQERIIYNPVKCDQCGDCVDVCPPKTLAIDSEDKLPLHGYCVMCRKCLDVCPVEVIGIPGIKEPKTRDLNIEGPIYIKDCVGCSMCVEECPVSAITLDKIGGEITIDEDTCIKCGVCSQTCPWDAVFISGKRPEKRSKTVNTFDLDADICIGCNSCVDACPGSFIEAKGSNLTVELPGNCPSCGLCENICPVDAITLDVTLGDAKPANEEGIVWVEDKCEFVGACANKCPTEAIRVVRQNGVQAPESIKNAGEPSFTMCVRCGACATVCPEDALKLTPVEKLVGGDDVIERNRIQFSPSKCTECGDCIEACPYDMLKFKEEGKLPVVGFCTLCEQCLKACPKGGLEFR